MYCPLCRQPDRCARIGSHTDAGQEYVLYECPACRGQFWTPLKNPGAHWYEHDVRYANRNQDPILKPNEKHLATLRYLHAAPGRVFDIGCGVGNFLGEAKRHGWVCAGIDFDRDAIAAAQQVFGLNRLEVTDLAGYVAKHPGEQFDLVTFFDVFEHIDKHNEFIEQVAELVRPGGYLALSVPYRDAWRWLIPYDLPPRHLTRWDPKSLSMYVERHGFVIRRVWRFPASIYFLVMKLRYRFGKWSSFGLVRRVSERTYTNNATLAISSPKVSNHIAFVRMLAKTKDIALFGLPALILWGALFTTRKRYTDFCLIAQRIS